MALKFFPVPFPIFSPPPPPTSDSSHPHHRRLPSELRFSRWNNANAEKFNERRRAQEEIEFDIRRHRRFTSATNILDTYPFSAGADIATAPKSAGTPSSPSSPSIPGKKSKYSKPENPSRRHPAFQKTLKITKLPQPQPNDASFDRKADIKISDDGLSYVVNGAPFEFKYSYTETPRVKPLKLREAPYAPFGPATMPRPWTGRAPAGPSKKLRKEFDSFKLPPANKKGVKPVQAPGPFRPGTGPRYVKTREEILGEPLTKAEVKQLIDGCLKTKRQLNMGRDGLTHNMLDNIHAHWKRRRVCKIKCKGVCTVDMDNVCQQLEEKTGGEIIFRQGGLLYLFRGRNYNYRTRPYFPLMLWKPVTPVYPRLIQRAPEGLTLQEATEMRTKGRQLVPICKLAKNGVYCNLAKEVREAFEACELVQIDCQGINGSDYRKVGAKLRDLVPCVLISFEHEHILMWRGKDWKSSFTKNDCEEAEGSNADVRDPVEPTSECQDIETFPVMNAIGNDLHTNASLSSSEEQQEVASAIEIDEQFEHMDTNSSTMEIHASKTNSDDCCNFTDDFEASSNTCPNEAVVDNSNYAVDTPTATIVEPDTPSTSFGSMEKLQLSDEGSHDTSKLEPEKLNMHYIEGPYMEGVRQLWKQALESGCAVVLADADSDADSVYQKAVVFAESAPPGPIFRHLVRKVAVREHKKQENEDLEVEKVATVSKIRGNGGKSFKQQKMGEYNAQCPDVAPPQGSLKVDELAKLLA